MANISDWKSLLTKWSTSLHKRGDPKLDALSEIYRTNGLTWRERAIESGQFFTVKSPDVYAVGSVGYGVIQTGSEPLRFINVDYQISYGDIANGRFTIQTELFIQGSDQSTWSYSGGIPVPTGKQLNTEFINDKPVFNVVVNPTVSLTGESDFILRQIEYFRDSSGNRETLTGIEESFFNNDKYVLIPPNSEALIVRRVLGDAGNSASVTIFYDFIEGEINV